MLLLRLLQCITAACFPCFSHSATTHPLQVRAGQSFTYRYIVRQAGSEELRTEPRLYRGLHLSWPELAARSEVRVIVQDRWAAYKREDRCLPAEPAMLAELGVRGLVGRGDADADSLLHARSEQAKQEKSVAAMVEQRVAADTAQLTTRITGLQEEVQRQRALCQTAEERSAALQQTVQDLRKQLAAAQADLSTAQAEASAAAAAATESKPTSTLGAEQHGSALQAEVQMLQTELRMQASRAARLARQYADANERIAALSQTVDELESKTEQQDDELVVTRRKALDADCEVTRLQEAATAHRRMLAGLQQEVQDAKQAREAQVQASQAAAAVAKHEAAQARQLLAEAQEQVAQLRASVSKARRASIAPMQRAPPAESTHASAAALCAAEEAAQTAMDAAAAASDDAMEARKEAAAALSNAKHWQSVAAEAQAENRALFSQILELKGNIRVFARVRPLNSAEQDEGGAVDVHGSSLRVDPPASAKNGAVKAFSFDRVFGPTTAQAEVYEEVAPLVRSVLDGYNSVIFAYGQTGSGKTYSMQGTPENPGINPRALANLFELSRERADQGSSFTISATMLEIYNDRVRDLLAAGGVSATEAGVGIWAADASGRSDAAPCFESEADACSVDLRRTRSGTVFPAGAVAVTVDSMDAVQRVLSVGAAQRAVCATGMNDASSRSHMVLLLHVQCVDGASGEAWAAKLYLVDLAGSERVSRSGVTGAAAKEAAAINKSLSSLGDVISALQAGSAHVPFRNSKLTWLMADALGGHNKALLLVQASPAQSNAEETLCSLAFAQRAGQVELGTAKAKSGTRGSRADPARAGKQAACSAASSDAAGMAALRRRVQLLEDDLTAEQAARKEAEMACKRQRRQSVCAADGVTIEKARLEGEIAQLREQVRQLQSKPSRTQARARSAHKPAAAAPSTPSAARGRSTATTPSRLYSRARSAPASSPTKPTPGKPLARQASTPRRAPTTPSRTPRRAGRPTTPSGRLGQAPRTPKAGLGGLIRTTASAVKPASSRPAPVSMSKPALPPSPASTVSKAASVDEQPTMRAALADCNRASAPRQEAVCSTMPAAVVACPSAASYEVGV